MIPAVLAAGVTLSPMHAQVTTATLNGTVADTTGASVPQAEVVLKNQASDDVRRTVSNGSGAFSFSAIPTGTYDVTITAPNFRPFSSTGIHLDPGDTRTVRDIQLSVGASTDTVEVRSSAEMINIDSGEQSSLISAEEIKRLSVQGRDVTELLKILPGFAISRGGAGAFDNSSYDPSQVQPSGALGQYAANGTPVNGQALLSDGVDITDPGNFGQAIQNVNYEQVAEVKISTSSFTADTAHGPIIINAVGKSGGNTFHGSLYTFARTSQLNSVDWIAKYSGQGKPPDRYIYPGFTIGGPILIPGTGFNKSRKLTFFVGGEEYAQRNAYAYGSASTATLTALVPTANMRKGIFSQQELQQYLGSAYTVDPNGGPCTYNGSTSNVPNQNICRVPVTGLDGSAIAGGNISRFMDPLSSIILNQMPLPNVASNGTYNWITTNLIRNDLWQAHGRIDFAANENNHFSANYGIEKGVQGVPQNEYYSARGNLGGVNIPGGGLISPISSQIASLNFAHTFSPSLTNEFYAAGAYFVQNFVAKNQAAIANNPYQGVFQNGSVVQPTLEDYGNDGLPLLRTPDTSFGGIYAKKQVRIAGDNLSKNLGAHALKAGVFYQWSSNPQVAPFINTNGTINQYYNGETFTDPVQGMLHGTGPVGSGSGGNYLANFAEGVIFQYSQSNIAPAPNLFFWNLSGYVQDHWRINKRLTIDYGVRLEHLTPWEDSHGQGMATFSPTAYAAMTNVTAPGITYHGMDKSVPNAGRPTRPLFFSPRGGFSLDLYGSGQTVLRGGAGVYRAHDSYNDAQSQNQTVLGLRTYTVSGPLLLSSIQSQQSVATSANGFVKDASVYGFNGTDDEEPRVTTYNLAIDQRLPGKMLVEIAYVGNHSDKLLNNGSTQNTTLDDLNSLPIGSLFGPQPNSRADTAATAGQITPILAPVGGGTNSSVGQLDQAHIDSYKKYPLYNHVFVPQHNAYANYNALQVGLTKQSGRAIMNVNYTFSKALGILGIGGSSTYSYPADPFNYANDYSFLPFDRRNIFNAAYSYALGDVVKNHLVGYAANGWELSGITNYQSGANLPSTLFSNFGLGGSITVPVGATATVGNNTSTCATAAGSANPTCQISVNNTTILGTPDVNLQPRLVGDPTANDKSKQQYINASALSLPALGTNGPARLGHLPGPGFFNTDLTAAKRFRVTDHSSAQLRFAAFNFINHANNTFTAVNPANYTLTVNNASTASSVNQALVGTNASSNSQFGYAPLREGRRSIEMALRFDF
ncbi:MAG: carboxypeptidase regulatory-like domain-containing protein [Janthinobacterium lividum]